MEAKKRKKLGTPKIGDTWPFPKIGVPIANDSHESIRANRVANRPCHQVPFKKIVVS